MHNSVQDGYDFSYNTMYSAWDNLFMIVIDKIHMVFYIL